MKILKERNMRNENEFLGKESVGKLLFKLAIPAITAQIINLLYNVVDRIYIGHIPEIGSLALTGVGVCLPVIMIISAFAALVSMGAAPNSSIYMGKKDNETAEKIMGNSFVLLIIISVILTIALLIWKEDLLLIFGASENTIDYSTNYMTIYAIGTLFVQIALGMNAFITAQGFAKYSMFTVLIGAIVNIILDPIFIFGLNMGVEGAALATIISQGISALWVILFLISKKSTLKLKINNFKINYKVILPCIALGIAPFIMQATESVLMVCFNSSLQKYGGDLAVGAMTILISVMQFSMLPLQGLSQGAQPIISYNYGAKNSKRVKSCFFLLLFASTIYSTLIWMIVMIFPKLLPSVFSDNEELINYASWAIKLYMMVSFAMGVQIACQMTLISIGNAVASVIVAIVRKIVLLIPLIYLMPLIFGYETKFIYLAEPVADAFAITFTIVLFIIQFRKCLKNIDSTKQEVNI